MYLINMVAILTNGASGLDAALLFETDPENHQILGHTAGR
jgi:hypothetical protein